MNAYLLLTAIGLVLIIFGAGALCSGAGWYRQARQVLERPWRVERFVYRHHRLFGPAIVVGALLLLSILARYHRISLEPLNWPSTRGDQLMLMARGVAWLFASLALIFGVLLGIRPSALKGVEAKSNRWVEASVAVSGPRIRRVGLLLLAAGTTCLLLAVFAAR